MKPFLFLLGLVVILFGLLATVIATQNRLMRKLAGLTTFSSDTRPA
jgi:hypothetical protein